MKNTLSITSDGTIWSCNCVDSVADGTNSLYIALEVGNVTSPQLNIWLNDVLKSTTNLTANEINYINVSPELFTANGVITFQYLDYNYAGQVFSINFPAELDGNLSVDKTSDYVFTAKYTTSGATYDAELSTTSENAVQNKVVTAALNNKVVVGGKNTKYLKQARFIIARYCSAFGWGVSIPLFPNKTDQIFIAVNGAFAHAVVVWDKKNGTITQKYVAMEVTMTLNTITYFF